MLGLILLWAPSLLCGVHVMRTGREMTWLWFFIIGPIIAPAIYVLAVVVPGAMGGRTARKLGAAARQALDPEREYRAAKAALEDAETVGNRMRLAQAAAGLGRWPEAEPLWAACVAGQFADDPVVLLGHANALIELGRLDEALVRLEALQKTGRPGESGEAALAWARAYDGLGKTQEADAPYRYAADRLPSLEAAARYVSFLAKAGRKEDAETALGEIDRRFAKMHPQLRGPEKPWRDMAERAVRG